MIDAKLLTPYVNHPVEFVEDLIFRYYPIPPKPKLNRHQIELFQSVVQGDWISVRSGRGRGKTSSVALLIPWYLATRPMARIVATAPKIDLLHDVLWSEINKWLQFSPLRELLKWSKEKIECAGIATWYAVARTANNKENLSGYHENYQMVIVDEASGVNDEILETVQETQSQNPNKKEIKTILISNPTRVTGFFYKTQMLEEWKKFWKALHFKPTPEELANDSGAQRTIKMYGGLEHDVVRVSVLGEFPSGNPMAILSYTDVWEAMNKHDVAEEGVIEIGADIARYGDDLTVLFYRYGYKVFPCLTYKKQDTVDTEMKILLLVRDLRSKFHYDKVIRIKIDDSNMGCVTKNVALLTPDGWRSPVDLKVGGKIYSKNSLGIMTEETILEVSKRENVRIIEADGCEFAWAHRIPYRTRKEHKTKMGDWETILGKGYSIFDNEFRWQGCFENFLIPEASGVMPYGGKKVYKKERIISPEKFANFLGWFISEGCVCGNVITIVQAAKNPNCSLIKKAILGVNENVSVFTSASGYNSYCFTDKWLARWLKDNCYVGLPCRSFNKTIPRYIKRAAVSIIRVFLSSFRLGDGHVHKGAANYSTSSPFLANDLLELIVKSGKTGIKRINHAKGSTGTIGGRAIIRQHDNYRVSEWKTMTSIGICGAKTEKCEREDAVYFIRISGETQLFINKFEKGKIFWSHNGGISDHLMRNKIDNIEVVRCLFGAAGNEYYSNAASIMWAELKKVIGKLELPRDDTLLEELCGRNWETNLDNKSRQKVESKDMFKARLHRSPDRADALVLCISNEQEKEKLIPKLVDMRDVVFHDEPVRFDFKALHRVELFGSIWYEKHVKQSALLAAWDKQEGRLTIFFEGETRMEGPEELVNGMTTICDFYNRQYQTNIKPRNLIYFGNRTMFGLAEGAMEFTNMKDGPYLTWQNRHLISIQPNWWFDLNGAILKLNELFEEKRIVILPDMPMLKLQLETWSIDNDRPDNDEHPLCLALANLISMLMQSRKVERRPKPLIPYGIKVLGNGTVIRGGEKEAFLNKVEKTFADGSRHQFGQYVPRIGAPKPRLAEPGG
jgi:hypothetical protein